MSLFDSIETTLKGDLGIAEQDARSLAESIVKDAETSFSGLLDTVLKQVENRPIGQILEGVYGIYKNVKSSSSPPTG